MGIVGFATAWGGILEERFRSKEEAYRTRCSWWMEKPQRCCETIPTLGGRASSVG